MTDLRQSWPRLAPAAHRDHRRGRHRPHGAPAGVRRLGLSGRGPVRHPPRRGARHGDAIRRRHGVRDARRSVRRSAARCSTSPCRAIRFSASSAACRRARRCSFRNRWARTSPPPRASATRAAPGASPPRINFQLRFSPNVLALRELIDRSAARRDHRHRGPRSSIASRGSSGRSSTGAPRLEVLYHSIHYLDTIRCAGRRTATACIACAVRTRRFDGFSDTRSTIILDYGDRIRCSLTLNHTHRQDRDAPRVDAEGGRHRRRGGG